MSNSPMLDDKSTLDDSTVSQFHTITTTKFVRFTSKNMSDFERIISKFTGLPKTQAMLAFYDTLRKHILDRRAHDVSLDDIHDELITQLYYTYKSLGYPGDRTAMLFAIAKNIEIGTISQCLAGYNTELAVNVIGWQAMFQEHIMDPEAHDLFFESLLPNDALNYTPDFYLTYSVGAQEYLQDEIGYPLKHWNSTEGTFFVSLSYDVRTVDSSHISEILRLTFPTFNIIFNLECKPDGAQTAVRCVIWKVSTENDSKELLGAIKLSFWDDGYDRVLMVYKPNYFLVRNMTDRVTLDTNPITDGTPSHLILNASIQGLADAENIVTIKELSHYNLAASMSEQLFFLN